MPKILIYGGTNLSNTAQQFVSNLTRQLLEEPSVTVVSGGFANFVNYPERISVDVCVRDAAQHLLSTLSEAELSLRFETWLPGEGKDRPNVQRFEFGKICRMNGLSHQARRFSLVLGVDAIITIAGEGHTQAVLDLAYAVDKPALPIAFTGGDSETFWRDYEQQIRDRFRFSNELTSRLRADQYMREEDMDSFTRGVATSVISAAQQWQCLVLMPFGGEDDKFYDEKIAPAIENASYRPHRIDRDNHSGRIFELFVTSLRNSRAVILDATGLNKNVMYELGYANALGIQPLIISRDSVSHKELPFYIGENKLVFLNAEGESLPTRIQAFLDERSQPRILV